MPLRCIINNVKKKNPFIAGYLNFTNSRDNQFGVGFKNCKVVIKIQEIHIWYIHIIRIYGKYTYIYMAHEDNCNRLLKVKRQILEQDQTGIQRCIPKEEYWPFIVAPSRKQKFGVERVSVFNFSIFFNSIQAYSIFQFNSIAFSIFISHIFLCSFSSFYNKCVLLL